LAEPDEETPWLVDGLLPQAGLSIIAARPKVGKSTLARTLTLAVARGERFLDRDTTAGTVLYLALEEKRAELRRQFKGALLHKHWVRQDSPEAERLSHGVAVRHA
jgi:RecA-family ATPase